MENVIDNFLAILELNFLSLTIGFLLPEILGCSRNNSVSLHVKT